MAITGNRKSLDNCISARPRRVMADIYGASVVCGALSSEGTLQIVYYE